MDIREQALANLPKYLNETDASWAFLGDFRGFPKITGDIDIAFDSRALNKFGHTLKLWSEQYEFKLIQVFQHEISSWFLIYVHISESGLLFIHPDICTDYRRSGRLILAEKILLNERIKVQESLKEGSWFEPRESYQFIYYLVKRLEKKRVREEHVLFFRQLMDKNQSEIKKILCDFFGSRLGIEIQNILNRDNSNVQCAKELMQLGKNTNLKFKTSFMTRIKTLLKNWYRLKNPTGLIVSCPNHPEILESLAKRWSLAFREIYHVPIDRPFPSNILSLLRRSTLVCCSHKNIPINAVVIDPTLKHHFEIDNVILEALLSRRARYLPSWLRV